MDIPVGKSVHRQSSSCKQVIRPQLSTASDRNVKLHTLTVKRHGLKFHHSVPACDACQWSLAEGRHLSPIWSLLEWQTPQVLLRKGMS